MKKGWILSLFLFSVLALSQKNFTLKEAVLGYYKGLYPSDLINIQLVKDRPLYVYNSSDFQAIEIKNLDGEQIKTIPLSTFKNEFPTMEMVPFFEKVIGDELFFIHENFAVIYDYNTAKYTKLTLDQTAENIAFNYSKKAVAYTVANNLFVTTVSNETKSITNNADKHIVSGQFIHRSEFGISKGIFWSPQGNCLAFYQKDESRVGDYPLVDVDAYPAQLKNIKYPMAGTASERAKVGIYDLQTQKTIFLQIDTTDEHYITNLSWSNDEKYILIAEVNRDQNHMMLNRYEIASGKKINTILEEKNEKWVEPEHEAKFIKTGNFLWMSERDGFMNVYEYTQQGKQVQQVTNFKWVVDQILGFDAKQKNVFVRATGKDPRDMKIYAIDLKTKKVNIITPEKGVHTAQLSENGDYLMDNFSSIEVPRQINLIGLADKKIKNVLTANDPLKDSRIGKTEEVILKSKDGFDLYGRMIKPDDFDPQKKYPVLVYVYGGPHAQLVTNDWLASALLWMHWLAVEKDYIVFTLDGRGSANRGFDFERVIHRQLGVHEMEDQLKGVDYLKGLSYVDSSRMAIYGWSFGGFMTTSLMLKQPEVFTTGVAGGPVTDWKYYEVMYGERYMDKPAENPEGYKQARLHNYIQNLKGKLLLIHGSIDNTVVPQHSMTLLEEAVKQEVQVDFFTYPMHEHNVRGIDRVHLMQKVLDYIVENNK